jgi:glycosyltransferase involved in cell wall biosynthesis
MKSDSRIAFVIDSLPSVGGGEKVLFTALEMYPRADIFTLVYNREFFTQTPIAHKKIGTSFINSLPFAHKHHRLFLPLMPTAIQSFNLCHYDTIVCFSYAVAHGVMNHNGTRHISYTYTPMRYAWTDINLNGTHTRKNLILNGFMNAFRQWDRRAASRVHAFAAISQAVSQRITDAYGRAAPVIYPPVDVERFHPNKQRENFYITVSRLVPHKRMDIIVQAFATLNLPLLVIGEGGELARLRSLATPNIQFLGYESDEKVAEMLGEARGFICAAEEDFGIAIVEAQAAGCPVITLGKGGALETVVNGVTGLFFPEQSVESLIEAVSRFEKMVTNFDAETIAHNAQRFSKRRFMKEFRTFVEDENK